MRALFFVLVLCSLSWGAVDTLFLTNDYITRSSSKDWGASKSHNYIQCGTSGSDERRGIVELPDFSDYSPLDPIDSLKLWLWVNGIVSTGDSVGMFLCMRTTVDPGDTSFADWNHTEHATSATWFTGPCDSSRSDAISANGADYYSGGTVPWNDVSAANVGHTWKMDSLSMVAVWNGTITNAHVLMRTYADNDNNIVLRGHPLSIFPDSTKARWILYGVTLTPADDYSEIINVDQTP